MTSTIFKKIKITKTIAGVTYVLEKNIYFIYDDKHFMDKIKYSLYAGSRQLKKKILFDIHYGKTHHYHIDNEEFLYSYTSLGKLENDFHKLVEKHFKEFYEKIKNDL